MGINKSAEKKKRRRIINRNRLQNRFYKSSVRSLLKVFLKDVEVYKIYKSSEKEEKIKKSLSSVYSMIDKAAKRRIFHKNKAARKKARLTKYIKVCIK